MTALLEVHNLTVHYRSSDGMEIPALAGVTFSVGTGEAIGLLGESGCGKTSTALSVLRLLPASGSRVSGRICFQGKDLLALPEREMERIRGAEISLIFQEPSVALNPVMRIGDQISEVLRAHRSWTRQRRRREVEGLLERVLLPDAASLYHAFPHELSGGQRQRVLIAQALACNPALVIADEPTTGLDTRTQAEILALLRELKSRSKTSFLFISHHPGVLAGLADRLLVMYAGRIVEEGDLLQTCRDPLHPYTRGLFRSMPPKPAGNGAVHKRHLFAIAGNPPEPDNLRQGCPFAPRCDARMRDCEILEPMDTELPGPRRVRCLNYEN